MPIKWKYEDRLSSGCQSWSRKFNIKGDFKTVVFIKIHKILRLILNKFIQLFTTIVMNNLIIKSNHHYFLIIIISSQTRYQHSQRTYPQWCSHCHVFTETCCMLTPRVYIMQCPLKLCLRAQTKFINKTKEIHLKGDFPKRLI